MAQRTGFPAIWQGDPTTTLASAYLGDGFVFGALGVNLLLQLKQPLLLLQRLVRRRQARRQHRVYCRQA